MNRFFSIFWLRLVASAFVAMTPLAWVVAQGMIPFAYALGFSAAEAVALLFIWDGTRRVQSVEPTAAARQYATLHRAPSEVGAV